VGGTPQKSQLALDLQEKSNDVDPRTEELHLCQRSHFCPAEFSLVNDEPWETHPFHGDKVRLWEHKLPSIETQSENEKIREGESRVRLERKYCKKTKKRVKPFLQLTSLRLRFVV